MCILNMFIEKGDDIIDMVFNIVIVKWHAGFRWDVLLVPLW